MVLSKGMGDSLKMTEGFCLPFSLCKCDYKKPAEGLVLLLLYFKEHLKSVYLKVSNDGETVSTDMRLPSDPPLPMVSEINNYTATITCIIPV